MLSIGKTKTIALKKTGNILSRLKAHDDQWSARVLFKAIKGIWELISPSKVYSIVSSEEYACSHNAPVEVLKTDRIGYFANAVSYGKGEEQILKEHPLPNLLLHCFSGVCAHYGSDFVINLNERLVVNDYCANNVDDNKGYEDRVNYFQKGRIAILHKRKVSRHIESGIMINGKFSYNYYHSIYENLIRLLVVNDFNNRIPKEVPLIIDEDVMRIPSLKRIYEILSNNLQRKTIVLEKDEMIKCGRLYTISTVNNLVPLHWDYTKGRIEDYVFDKEYVLKLRNTLLAHRDTSVNLPKRFFISRKKTAHRKFNEDELFSVLKPLGFERIAPEEYPIEQQMTLFHDAEWVFGGSGAALTNLLFTCEKCVVVCVYRNSQYIPPVFTPPMCFNGGKMYYFQSSQGTSIMKAHSDFTIDIEQFSQFVDCIFASKN